MQGFTDLIAWREAVSLAARVVAASEHMDGVGARAAAEQLVDAAESIHSNIAEGYGRGINRDCIRFLNIARASCNEVESRLVVSREARRLPRQVADELINDTRKVRWLNARYTDSVIRRMKRKDDGDGNGK